MKALPSIDDLRERARRNVPKMFFDYADAGSYNQETLRGSIEHQRIRGHQPQLGGIRLERGAQRLRGKSARENKE